MLELRHVTAGYGEQVVLRGVSAAFFPGEVAALIGPNGCGKSTLLKAAAGLIPCAGGQVLLNGNDIATLRARDIAQKVAYLAQSRDVPGITAGRLVLHGRFPHLGYPRRYRPQDMDIARRALEWTGAYQWADRPLETLSGGQRQKVYLAMALAQDTETILMDEPTTYLDVRHQLEVMKTARRLADMGRAVALVLHDLGLAMRCADRIHVLSGGAIQCSGAAEEVYAGGALDEVFGVRVRRTKTENGWQYFCEPLHR